VHHGRVVTLPTTTAEHVKDGLSGNEARTSTPYGTPSKHRTLGQRQEFSDFGLNLWTADVRLTL
jgi:hypothetical protein